jgi:hypothetical protein
MRADLCGVAGDLALATLGEVRETSVALTLPAGRVTHRTC